MINKKYNIIRWRTAFIVVLAGAAMLVLAACGNSTSASNSGAQPTTAPISAATTTVTTDVVAVPTAQATQETSGGAAPTQVSSGQTGALTEINGTLREWAITLSRQEAPAGKVRFTVTNQGQIGHNFTVVSGAGLVAQTITFDASDGAQTLEVDLQPGTYTIVCDLPGHAARGQRATLVVK